MDSVPVSVGASELGTPDGVEAGKSLVEREVPEPLSKTLEDADVLFQKGLDALKADDFTKAVNCLSRALEIRVAHYGECGSSQKKRAKAFAKSAKGQPLGSDDKGESPPNGVKGEAPKSLLVILRVKPLLVIATEENLPWKKT
eukprot:Gb_05014 [translate_table: standard]